MISGKLRRLQAVTLIITLILPIIPIGSITSYARTQDTIDSEIEENEAKASTLEIKIDAIVEQIKGTHDTEKRTELVKQKEDLDKQLVEVNKSVRALQKEVSTSDDDSKSTGKDSPVTETETVKENGPSKGDTDLDDKDLVVSKPIIDSSKDSVRVTEMYSINNSIEDCYFRPKVEEVPLLANRVLKVGKYAAAYTGFFNLDYSTASKPKGSTSRALEILGYDYLLSDETYDADSNKYNRMVLSDDAISEETAIMDLYKVLNLEMYDIKMYHKKATYTSGNSPAATLLNRSTVVYSGGGNNSIKSVDTMQAYETHVFVSRTNPELYMKKLSQDFNISVSSKKVSKLTNADFIILCARMMQFYGEPEMSENEMNQLIQVYGADIPNGMDDEVKSAWIYLKARGVLNIDNMDLYGYLTKENMFDILMRIKDKDSRVNYKDIKVVLALNSDIISQGYYPTSKLNVREVNTKVISTDVDIEKSTYYDYLIPVNDYSKFKNQFGNTLNTMYVSNSPTGIGTSLDGSSYAGVDGGLYYHYKVPIALGEELLYDKKYIRIETPGSSDKPSALYLEVGGGILRYSNTMKDSTGSISMFKRRPFKETEYPEYVDENRYDPTKQFDWDSWNKEEEKKTVKPDKESLGFDDWQGGLLTQIAEYTWAKDDTTGRWRCYKGNGYDKVFIQSGLYYLGNNSDVTAPQDNIYAFDGDGYMITGWYKENNYWYYFTNSGQMTYSQKRVIDNVTYDFDQYGRWIDMKWNVPTETEDIWSSYDNVAGTWQLDGGKWWYMLQGGDWLFGGIYKINDKFYSFDEDGYMSTGWIKDKDYWFYFDESDGYMYMNATTPDGAWCGQNGRASSSWKLSMITTQLFRMFSAAVLPIVSYANSFNLPDDSSTLTSSGLRWYRHTIPVNMVKNEQSEVKSIVEDAGGTLTRDGSNYVIRTKRNQANMLSRLSLNTESGYELIVNSSGILNLSSEDKLLVPYTDLASAGLFTEVTIDKVANKVKLSSGINRSKNATSDQSTYEGFGEIVLDNTNHTILVGTTIYRVPSNTTLFTYLKNDEQSYTYIDNNGKEQKQTGEMLYIDFRAAFGWSADTTSFYRDSSGQVLMTVGLSNRNNSINTVSKDIIVQGGQKKLKAVTLNGYSRPLFLLSNSYPVANWAMLRVSKDDGTVNNKLVVSYYKKQFGSIQQPDDYQKLVNLLKTPKGTPEYNGYCYRLFDVDSGVANTLTDSTNIEPGKFYVEKDFGLVYAPPTDKEWNSGDGYTKYLKGEYPLPITISSMNSMWIEKSVPYIDGLPYGTNVLNDKLIKEKVHPQIGALSYLLYDRNESNQTLNNTSINTEKTETSNDLTSDSLVYFGQNRLYRLKDGSYVIDGLKYGNEFVKIKKTEYQDDPYIYVNRFFSKGYNSSNMIGSRSSGTSIYVSVPAEVEYTTVPEDELDKKSINYSTLNVLNSFNNFAKFKVDRALESIRSSTSMMIIVSMQVLPSILFVCSMIVLLISILSDWKPIRMLCNRFIDPIRILTANQRNVETANGIGYITVVLTTTIALGLFANGNFLRVLSFLLTLSGEVLNIFNNM